MTYLLSIDQGTSSSRAILFDDMGRVCQVFQKPLELLYPQDGWVEQNPKMLVDDVVECMCDIVDNIDTSDVAGVGITNQRETVVLWNRETGQAVYNAIVWQDRRTAEFCNSLKGDGLEEVVRRKTGLLLDPYFSATKIKWILDHVDDARALADSGRLLSGTIDSYLLWHLTSGGVHATDVTNASRTMLYNIVEQCWDLELLELFDIPLSILPDVRDNVSNFGQISSEFIGGGLIVSGMAGDQQAALIGQGCFQPGMVKSTYGTGCFALMNIGQEFKSSNHRLLTTIGYRVGSEVCYALEGSAFNAGTAVQFLRDNLGLFDDAEQTAVMARSVEDNGGVYFVPAFTGLGAPHWDPNARGVLCGLSRDTSSAHIVRAALEAQGYQTQDLLRAMAMDSGGDITHIRADGGLVANEFVCQFLADITGAAVEVPEVAESTAWGAACLAGVQTGVFSSLEDAASRWRSARVYTPSVPSDDVGKLYSGWLNAVGKVGC